MKFWNCILRVQEIKLLEILGHQISIFQQGIKFCGPHFSYLIFEAVRFWGFWGPAEMSNEREWFWRKQGHSVDF